MSDLLNELRRVLGGCEASLTELDRDHPEWMRPVDRKILANARAALARARGETA